jgi:hypothetical protein
MLTRGRQGRRFRVIANRSKKMGPDRLPTRPHFFVGYDNPILRLVSTLPMQRIFNRWQLFPLAAASAAVGAAASATIGTAGFAAGILERLQLRSLAEGYGGEGEDEREKSDCAFHVYLLDVRNADHRPCNKSSAEPCGSIVCVHVRRGLNPNNPEKNVTRRWRSG